MKNIIFNKIGKILEGDDTGYFIKIINDIESTGGYLILISKDKSFKSGFDSWVENKKMLEKYFEESHWSIDWKI